MKSYNLYFGFDCKVDEVKAKELCLESAKEGNKFADGMRFFFGWDTEKDIEKSFQKFKESVQDDPNYQKKDTPYSAYFLALLHHYGKV